MFVPHPMVPWLTLLKVARAWGQPPISKVPGSEPGSEPLTARLQRHAGVYRDKSHAPELKNVLLLTAANSGYLEMLTNWESMVEGGVFLLTFHFQVVIVYFRAHTVIIIFPTQMAKKWGGQKKITYISLIIIIYQSFSC